jgi:hypothetical protein
MIGAHSVTALGLIAAYAIQGLIEGGNSLQLFIVLLLLGVFYVPAVLSLKKPATRK